MIKFNVNGLIATVDKLTAAQNNVQTAVSKALMQGGLLVQSSAVESIQHSGGGGRDYKRHGIVHSASLPGEPPATDTGALASSIQSTLGTDGLSVVVGSTLIYAPYLEYGTRDIEPRPYLNPALDVNRTTILTLVTNAVNKAMTGKGA